MKVNSKEEYEYIRAHIKTKPQDKDVTKQEFIDFVNSYPRRLICDECGISIPPVISYNDFEIGWCRFNLMLERGGYNIIKKTTKQLLETFVQIAPILFITISKD